jgi:hypothetical protein
MLTITLAATFWKANDFRRKCSLVCRRRAAATPAWDLADRIASESTVELNAYCLCVSVAASSREASAWAADQVLAGSSGIGSGN